MLKKINPQIAELLGAHIGDGTLYKTNRGVVWELRGSLDEKIYYIENITPLLESIFDIAFISKFRNDGGNGVWGIQTSKKQIIYFFLDYEMPIGSKTYIAKIPKYIFDSNLDIQRSFIRGLFDTDGCLRFEKINSKSIYDYPKIEFGFASKILRDNLKKLLDILEFRSYIWFDKHTSAYKLCLSGKKQLEKWIIEISPRNQKHLNKYNLWKDQGFILPRSHNLVLRRSHNESV